MAFRPTNDAKKLIGRSIADAFALIKNGRKNSLDLSEMDALYDLVEERLNKIHPDHHLARAVISIAASWAPAAKNLRDLDGFIKEVAEWFSRFKNTNLMEKLSELNSDFHCGDGPDSIGHLRKTGTVAFFATLSLEFAGEDLSLALLDGHVVSHFPNCLDENGIPFQIGFPINSIDDDDDDRDDGEPEDGPTPPASPEFVGA